MFPKRQTIILLLIITAVLVACGGTSETTQVEVQPAATEVIAGEPSTGSEGASGPVAPTPSGEIKVETTRVVVDTVVIAGEGSDGGVSSAVSLPASQATLAVERSEDSEPVTGVGLDPVSQLTAGEVDDNAQWDDYLLYLRNYAGPAIIPVDVSNPYKIWVTNELGNPVVGAPVIIQANGQEITTLRTHSNGRVYFFPHAYPVQADSYMVSITLNDQPHALTIPADSPQQEWFITHPAADPAPSAAQLDVLFLLDTTGSMADEIAQLTDNIQAISAQVDALPSRPDVRFGMVTYRDRGDAYLTNVFDFTPDIEVFAEALAQISAEGGGDYPEDLNEALLQALSQPTWRLENSVSLIFLIADAPPHLDYGQENHYVVSVLETAEMGIKIYPIASSGLDEQGEYIFRQLAQFTGGRFVFLTYGAAGPGTTGSETTMTVEDYTVSALDQLIVKIVQEELAFLEP